MNLPQGEREFEALLDYLKHERGCDLSGYKRTTLERRLQHRMQEINVVSYQDYIQYLQNHSEELKTLLDTVFINVSSFFRDRDIWDYLASSIIPRIIASKELDEPIRVWSAGCALGQEVYSLAILLAEALGIESYLERVQFYATDVDEDAIKQARFATYNDREVMGLPRDLLDKYFEQTEQGYVFDRILRSKIVFGCHNLTQDAPMSQIDLLFCRNVLMYFDKEAQASILVRFHFALKNLGFLVLGKSETLINRRPTFNPISVEHHVYKKSLNLELKDYLSINPKLNQKQALDATTRQIHIWQTAYQTSPFAQLAIAPNGRLVVANERANALFKLTPNDLNRPFKELEPGKLVGSSISLKTLYGGRSPMTLKNIEWSAYKETKYLDIFITPVFDRERRLLGINLTFIDSG
ncbi:MAG: protein-glutamate O-methyltransferase CheR [Hydrococcus sp. Prado102]|nr:protein-glutamate O-methyltransferase CheR [Hydrococcus sp. Prado102]